MDSGLQSRNHCDRITKFPTFSQPFILGYFSVNSERMFEPNGSQLRYFKPPQKFPLDLKLGYSRALKKPESAYEEKLDFLLKFIVDNYEKCFSHYARQKSGEPLIGHEFVCYRGNLRLIMNAPYERQEEWSIHVTKFMDTFYMCKLDTDKDKFERANKPAQYQEICSWGFKFEQYCLVESPNVEAQTDQPVNECEEFSAVFRTKLNGISLLYGAEMDGIISEQPVDLATTKLENLRFVELKTTMKPKHPGQQATFLNHKTRHWWAQSYLVGVRDIYVGLRDDKGLVDRVQHMDVHGLTKLGGRWSATVCVNFLEQFLRTVKSTMRNVNCPHTTFEFKFDPRTGRISYTVLQGKTRYSLLPDWYIAHLKRESVSAQRGIF